MLACHFWPVSVSCFISPVLALSFVSTFVPNVNILLCNFKMPTQIVAATCGKPLLASQNCTQICPNRLKLSQIGLIYVVCPLTASHPGPRCEHFYTIVAHFWVFFSSVGWTFEEMALMNVSSNYSVAKLHKKPVKWCPQKSKKGGQKWFSTFVIWASFCDSSNSLFAHFVTSDLPQRCWHICNNYVELARPHECCKMTHKTETCHLCRFAKVHFRDTKQQLK